MSRKDVPEMVLWSVPLYAMPAIIKTMQTETAAKILNGKLDEADAGLWALRKMTDEYEEQMREIERLNAPDPEPEEGDDE